MAKKDTMKFLRLMNEANEAIAARQAKEEEDAKGVGLDPFRLKTDAARHADGPLRARVHPRSRPAGARNAFGHISMKPDGGDR